MTCYTHARGLLARASHFNNFIFYFFCFFQAEDGIRDVAVTGVQTCALPIYSAPMAYPAIVLPSKTRSARWLMMTRSLNVPGSPSSALQTMYLKSLLTFRQASHFLPVGKPAPPRPRSLDFLTSSITCSGVILMAARSAVPPSMGAKTTGPERLRFTSVSRSEERRVGKEGRSRG